MHIGGLGGAGGSRHGGASGSSSKKKKNTGLRATWKSMKTIFGMGNQNAPIDPHYDVDPETIGPADPTWDKPASLMQRRIDQATRDKANKGIGKAATKYFTDIQGHQGIYKIHIYGPFVMHLQLLGHQ